MLEVYRKWKTSLLPPSQRQQIKYDLVEIWEGMRFQPKDGVFKNDGILIKLPDYPNDYRVRIIKSIHQYTYIARPTAKWIFTECGDRWDLAALHDNCTRIIK